VWHIAALVALERPLSRFEPPPDALPNLFGLRQPGSCRNGLKSLEDFRLDHERAALLSDHNDSREVWHGQAVNESTAISLTDRRRSAPAGVLQLVALAVEHLAAADHARDSGIQRDRRSLFQFKNATAAIPATTAGIGAPALNRIPHERMHAPMKNFQFLMSMS
jgi:hypothetical protein